MISINKCPSSLEEGFISYSHNSLKQLFNGLRVSPYLPFDIDKFRSETEINESIHRISVSGMQEKFPAIIKDNEIKIADKNERSTHILKPVPWDQALSNRKLIPANEHLTMQIASQVYDIQTAANGLCFTPKGQPVYITRRFDILLDGTKLLMEDFASVIGKNEQIGGIYFKYNGNYGDIARAIKKNVSVWMVDMERFFELIVFNYIYANGDAHLKNFSLIQTVSLDFRLAPAYDLINTSLHINGEDFGLDGGLSPDIEKSDIMDKTGHPCRLDFENFGLEIGLVKQRMKKILDKYTTIPQKALYLIGQSFLPEKYKRSYMRIVNERISRFNRLGNKS